MTKKATKKSVKKVTKKATKKTAKKTVKSKYPMKVHEGDEPRINVTKAFVKYHKFKIDTEVANKLAFNEQDILGFEQEVAIDYVSFEAAKPHLKDEFVERVEVGKDKWIQITDVMEAVQDFLDYMVFAWMKAKDERGISAGRSIVKLATWMKILGRPDVAKVLSNPKLYKPYGKPALVEACKMLGIKYPKYLEE